MKTFNENDVVKVNKNIIGLSIEESIEVSIPNGTIVTIVHIYGKPEQADAYEIEAYLSEIDKCILATVKIIDLENICPIPPIPTTIT